MLKDITLGQYFPGNSFMHRLDPRMKLILTLLYVVSLFLVPDFWGFAIIGALMILIIAFSGISLKVVFRGLRPLLFIIVFTAFFRSAFASPIWQTRKQIVFPSISIIAFITSSASFQTLVIRSPFEYKKDT